MGVGSLDQADFPLPPPGADRPLAQDRGVQAVVLLEPHEALAAVDLGEAGKETVPVLVEPLAQPTGYADEQQAARATRGDVDDGGGG